MKVDIQINQHQSCTSCPFFEWFEGGINAGWCNRYQRPTEQSECDKKLN